MATNQNACGALLFAGNGANRPLHQDRQVLRASDLALEQTTQDAMLARARRYLHGWGIVAGFMPEVKPSFMPEVKPSFVPEVKLSFMPERKVPNVLTIGPGYGVTPLGDELFLPESVSLPNAAEVAVLCCGPSPRGCEDVDLKAMAAKRAVAASATVTAWLIARPASREADPRAGVPEGCAHPAYTLLPSRRCGGVEFAILCTLPPSHQPKPADCERLMPLVCGMREGDREQLPWEALPEPDENFLVIARLTVERDNFIASIDSRRTLWPVALIQDWIVSCLCPMMREPRKEPTPRPPEVKEPTRPPPKIPPGDVLDPTRPPTTPPRVIDPPRPKPFPGEVIDPTRPKPLPDEVIDPIRPTKPVPGEVFDPTRPPKPLPIDVIDVTPPAIDPVPFVVVAPETPIIREAIPATPDVVEQPPTQIPSIPVEVIRDTPAEPVLTEPGSRVVSEASGLADELAPLARTTDPSVALPQDEVARVRDTLSGSVTNVAGIGTARAESLAGIGVTTEGQFLTAPTTQLAKALKLPENKVTEMKEATSARRNLGLTFR